MAVNPVSIGLGYSFFLSENAVWCCGKDTSGALGLGNETRDTKGKLHRVTTLSNITFVSCGQGHTLFLDIEGTVYGCGWNGDGQLGLGNIRVALDFNGVLDLKYPVVIPGLPKIQILHTRYNHSIFLDFEGGVWVCGWNNKSQLGLRNVSHILSGKTLKSTKDPRDMRRNLFIDVFRCRRGSVDDSKKKRAANCQNRRSTSHQIYQPQQKALTFPRLLWMRMESWR